MVLGAVCRVVGFGGFGLCQVGVALKVCRSWSLVDGGCCFMVCGYGTSRVYSFVLRRLCGLDDSRNSSVSFLTKNRPANPWV